MPQIKWTKDDVIKRFKEAIAGVQAQAGGKPGLLQSLIDKVKGSKGPSEGERPV